jgi:hypothetical protein
MGSKEPVRLTSGTFKGSREQALTALIGAVYQGSVKGAVDSIAQYQHKIALQYGALREGFGTAVMQTIRRQKGNLRISVSPGEVYSRLANRVSYAEHHLEVGPTGLPHYKDPTTPGTEPIKWRKFKAILVPTVQAAIKLEVQKKGIRMG